MVSESVLAISTISLIVELVAFSLLLFGYHQKRMRKYHKHGVAMTIAVALHLVVILTWMIYSLIAFFSSASLDLGNILQVTALTHVALGIIAASVGVWLVGTWHLQTDVQKCFGRKRIMLATITAWSGAFVLGCILYAVLVMS